MNNNLSNRPNTAKAKIPLTNWLILGVVTVIIFVGIYFLFFYQVPLDITTKPDNSAIIIDNQKIDGQITAKPGQHKLEIRAEGYLTYQKNLQVNYFGNKLISIDLQKVPTFKVLDNAKGLDQGSIKYLSFDEDNNSLFYLKDNTCWRLNLSNNEKPEKISPAIFKNIHDLIWTKNHLGAIVQVDNPHQLTGTKFYRNSDNRSTFFYDFMRYDLLNQTSKFWGEGIGNIAINPDLTRIAYYYNTNAPESSLVISDINRSFVRRVAKISGYSNPYISWMPNKEYILIYNSSQISVYDSYLDRLRKLDERVYSAQVSSDSKKILYLSNVPTEEKPASLMNIDGTEKNNLEFSTRLSNLNWYQPNKLIGVGKIDGQNSAFDFNSSNNTLTEIAWPEVNSDSLSEIEVDYNNNKIYLVINNQLVSLNIIEKQY